MTAQHSVQSHVRRFSNTTPDTAQRLSTSVRSASGSRLSILQTIRSHSNPRLRGPGPSARALATFLPRVPRRSLQADTFICTVLRAFRYQGASLSNRKASLVAVTAYALPLRNPALSPKSVSGTVSIPMGAMVALALVGKAIGQARVTAVPSLRSNVQVVSIAEMSATNIAAYNRFRS